MTISIDLPRSARSHLALRALVGGPEKSAPTRRPRQAEKRTGVRQSRRSGRYGPSGGVASLPLFPCAALTGTLIVAAAAGRRTGSAFFPTADHGREAGGLPDDRRYCVSATIGSIFVARRAGTAQAAKATTARTPTTNVTTAGSVALMPNNWLSSVRRSASAPAAPTRRPD